MLEYETDLAISNRFVGDILTKEIDMAVRRGVGRFHSCDDSQQCRFAGTRGTEQRYELAVFDL